MNDTENVNYVELTADIVSAYVSNNPTQVSELSSLIATVNSSLASLNKPAEIVQSKLVPAVNPKRSVHDNYIICLEDGKKFKTLKRHLSAHYGMTPEEYRAKWDLPPEYPMIAANYSARRSELAIKSGLGQKTKRRRKPTPAK
jgi:predicted transcriptional regulator